MSDFERELMRAAQIRRAQLNQKPAELVAIEAKMRDLHRQLNDTGGYGDIGWMFETTEDNAILCRRNGVTRAIWRHYSGEATALYPPHSKDASVIAGSISQAIELTADMVVGLLKI